MFQFPRQPMPPSTRNPQPATRVILFDIDGTLITTGGAGKRAFGQACEETLGIPKATDTIQLGGRTDLGIAREILQAHHLQPRPEAIQQTFEAYLRHLAENLNDGQSRILPGVIKLIEDLKQLPQPPTLALLTGNLARGAQIKLHHLNLWQHFAWGIYGDHHPQRNALAHDALKMAREKIDPALSPAQILIIGDTIRDIQCARAIGARVLAVTTGEATREELTRHHPDLLLDDLTQTNAKSIATAP